MQSSPDYKMCLNYNLESLEDEILAYDEVKEEVGA